MLNLMAAIPEMSDIIITVLAARRRRQLDIVAEPLPGLFDLIVCSEVLIYVKQIFGVPI